MEKILVCIPHTRTTKWIQIIISSLKKFKNEHQFDIMVVNNGLPSDRSLLGLTETGLSENVRIEDNKYIETRSHAGALDFALSIIDEKEYPYFFSAETDCRALKNSWLDWFRSHMIDQYVSQAGWYWPGGDREYIHTGGCLYSTKILKRLKKQIKENDNYVMCYGTDLKRRMYLTEEEDGSPGSHYRKCMKSQYHGPFTEQRGFQEIWSKRSEKFYQEPGAWPYYRCQVEYECVKLPGVLLWKETGPSIKVAEGTWYGLSVDDAWWVHYWAGTVSHNWEIMKVRERWQRLALPYWIDREDQIWKDVVPESVRKKTLDMNLCKTGEDEKQFILNHPNFLIPESEVV